MKEYDAIVIGGGPAGLGAAIEVAKAGGHPVLIDENARPGGQLFKQIHKFFGSREHYAGTRGFAIGEKLLQEAEDEKVEVQLNTRVWGIFPDHIVTAVSGKEAVCFRGKTIILAAGASENSLSFPGCTLPGVMMAGAAQTMMNLYRTLPGKEILMIGSGNVGLIVAYQLMQAGAHVKMLIDAAAETNGYEVHAAKIKRAGVPIRLGHTIVRAEGNGRVESAVICKVDAAFHPVPGTEEKIDVDTVCVAVGLSPRVELSALAGCRFTWAGALGGQVPVHTSGMETTVPGIYVAGDGAGTEEASTALDQGRMAGVSAAHRCGLLSDLREAEEHRKIQERLDMLRSGQFGEKRKSAEQAVWKAAGE